MKKTLIFLMSFALESQRPILTPGNSLEQLIKSGVITTNTPIKLHLGCGINHLDGYVNIDYPPSEHTAQEKIGSDIFGDIKTLSFPEQSIDEVRLHHVFEHFDRPTALALLCQWQRWLKIGGILYIETPDFEESIKLYVTKNLSYHEKQMILRHIFGSHEASWAYHYDGWYKEKYYQTFRALGFEIIKCDQDHWSVIYNIHIHAQKKHHVTKEELAARAKNILRFSMVSDLEQKMWQIWCHAFDLVFY